MNPSPYVAARRAAALLPPDDHHEGSTGRRAPRGDPDPAPPVFDGFTVHQWSKHGQHLVGHAAACPHVDAEVVILLTPVPDAERIGHATVADQIQDAHLFSEPDGIPQRNRHCGQKYRQPRSPGGDCRCQDQRDGQMAIVSAMVLREHRDDRPPRLWPGAHVDGRGAERGGRSGPIGDTHVEPEREHQYRLPQRPRPTVQRGDVVPVMSTQTNLTFVVNGQFGLRASPANARSVRSVRPCLLGIDLLDSIHDLESSA
ncbi:MAG: hypothetical protein JWR32_1204 [Mycobacterium sp.]|jgi:hypothetical protein|nr:hypothetical protein [Mycobacterium sp.]